MVAANGARDFVSVRGSLLVACLAEELGDGRACMGAELSLVSSALESLDAFATRGGFVVFGRGRHSESVCRVCVWGLYIIMVLCIRCSVGVVYIYWFAWAGISGLTVGVDGCRGCVFCRLVCVGVRGGLYYVVRTYVGGWSGVIRFVYHMCGGKLLSAMVCQV